MRNEVEEAQVNRQAIIYRLYSLYSWNFSDNLDETGGNSTANNVTDNTVTEIETEKVGTAKWYTEPPFNYDESELISCKDADIYDDKDKKFNCYATVNNYTDLGPVLISDWLSGCGLIG